MSELMLEVGATVGEYRIEGLVGQGGMGQVYGAIHPVIGKRAAIKVLRRELCADPEVIERFVLEARAVNQIGHPNIVDVFAFGALPDGRQYMVMEWLRGESLSARLERSPPPALDEACELLVGVCAALDAAHAAHIVHRDLKPHNVFLVQVRGAPTMVKLLDFGLVKLMGSDDVRLERTRSGSLLGTPAYMSPEQARGRGVDHRTDLYALGVMAFELMTGRLPYLEPSAMEIVVAHLQQPVPVASAYRRGLPPEVDALVGRLMAKNPAQRPELPEVVDALRAIQRIAQGASATTAPMPIERSTAARTSVPASVPAPAAVAPAIGAAPIATTTLSHAAGQHAVGTEIVTVPASRRRVLAVAGLAAVLIGALTFIAVGRARRGGSSGGGGAAAVGSNEAPALTTTTTTVDAGTATGTETGTATATATAADAAPAAAAAAATATAIPPPRAGKPPRSGAGHRGAPPVAPPVAPPSTTNPADAHPDAHPATPPPPPPPPPPDDDGDGLLSTPHRSKGTP